VVDSQLSSAQVREALRSSLEAGGWIAPDLVPPDEAEAAVEELMDDMVRVARHFPVGSVVRRRLSQFYVL
jgi:hypothetical protein